MDPKYARRRRADKIAQTLCWAAAAFGLTWLAFILGALLWNGFAGLGIDVFTQDTPGPGSAGGGLLNAIIGSLILTILGVAIGTPIGMLAGTYMAEYGRNARITQVVRFINDILLSAPSIIIGLFIYQAVVVPMQHFSGLAGALALAVIVIPVVVRTTEDMLLLVPNQLREASIALGMPRAYMIMRVAYSAARAGIVTGVLLAIARASGETAPLLFTSLSSPFRSYDLTKEMANLPVVINNFAGSPYENWRQLAWTGALLITFAVLALSVGARVLTRQGASK